MGGNCVSLVFSGDQAGTAYAAVGSETGASVLLAQALLLLLARFTSASAQQMCSITEMKLDDTISYYILTITSLLLA